jgi:hypothetical protein
MSTIFSGDLLCAAERHLSSQWVFSPMTFWQIAGTTPSLVIQTCMNEQPKLKIVHKDSNTGTDSRVRTSARTSRTAQAPTAPFHPARGLMICIGWLRLYQTIISGAIPSSRRSGR